MILYFSGTRNSAYLANRIAAQTGDTIVSINDYLKQNKPFNGEPRERLIFVVPTYAWRVPAIVEQWILKTRFQGNSKAYFILNCGDGIGNAAKYAENLCIKKGFQYMGCAQVIMPENYIAMFNAPDTENAKKIINKAVPKMDALIEKIQQNKPFETEKTTVLGSFLSGPVNKIFYSLFVHDKKFHTDEKCIACHKCEQACPLNNITMINNTPIWHGNCTHCMACITICPTGAIEYGRKSIGQPRYRCPYE